jgi:hypothetical protein
MLNSLIERVMLVYPLAWNRLYKKLHFGDGAPERYKYALRDGERRSGPPVKGSYTAKKLWVYGHTRPLEFTGRSMEDTLSQDHATAGRSRKTGFWSRAKLGIGFNRKNPHSFTNPAAEVTKVLPEEQRVLNSLADEKLRAEFRRHSGFRG